MTGKIVTRKGVDHFYLDGREVTEEEFRRQFPEQSLEGLVPKKSNSVWPMLSDALAVHPEQIAEARERDRKRGVPTEYAPDGRAVITSAAHQKQLAKTYGCRPMRGY
jgi:hypothetical protein